MLPSHVDADKIEASAQDGVLKILVPKPRETRGKRIQVRGGDRRAVTARAWRPATAADMPRWQGSRPCQTPLRPFPQAPGGNGRSYFRGPAERTARTILGLRER